MTLRARQGRTMLSYHRPTCKHGFSNYFA